MTVLDWLRNQFERHPHLPPGTFRTVVIGFIVCAAATIVMGVATTVEAFLGEPKASFSLTLTVILLIGAYSGYVIAVNKSGIDIIDEETKDDDYSVLWRYGEVFGVGLLFHQILLGWLYLLKIAPHFPEQSGFLTETLIVVLVGHSIIKFLVHDKEKIRPRIKHNNLFFLVSVAMASLQILSFLIYFFDGIEVPRDFNYMYIAILGTYVVHNRALEIYYCSKAKNASIDTHQRGELVGSMVMLTGLSLYLMRSLFGAFCQLGGEIYRQFGIVVPCIRVNDMPNDFFSDPTAQIIVITFVMLVASSAVKFYHTRRNGCGHTTENPNQESDTSDSDK